MSEKKYAIIWRQSVYDTGHCPRCGAQLIGEDMEPMNVYYDMDGPHGKKVLCTGCGLYVADVRPYDGPLEPGTYGGHWGGAEGISVRMYAVTVSGPEMFSLLMMRKEKLDKLFVHEAPPRFIHQQGDINVLLYMTPDAQAKAFARIRKVFQSARKIDTPAFVPGEAFLKAKDKQAFKEEPEESEGEP